MRLLVFLCLALVLAACATDTPDPTPDPQPETETIPFRKDGTLDFLRDGELFLTIDLEIADSDSSRQRGLMQRASLPNLSGMLFVFDAEGPQSFWMANTPLALDILFVNADSMVVDIHKYTKPLSPGTIDSAAPAQYVIEVTAGFSDTHGLTETDRVRWRHGE